MSKPVEGVSRWQQRKAAKAHMYATSTEQEGRGVAARRQLATDSKYVPRTGQNWKGSAWGLASTQVSGRQNEKHTRFSSGARRGELWYGEKRQLNTDLPPDDAPNFLARGSGGAKASSDIDKLAKEAADLKRKREEAKAAREKRRKPKKSSSSSSSSSFSS
eukprot:Transcript_22545.p1 GENE.Transcript_22545~~Transcript_22545.p1  ORF type:complete len:171 (-),score=57.91 Transcript_22545:28-510(-)